MSLDGRVGMGVSTGRLGHMVGVPGGGTGRGNWEGVLRGSSKKGSERGFHEGVLVVVLRGGSRRGFLEGHQKKVPRDI